MKHVKIERENYDKCKMIITSLIPCHGFLLINNHTEEAEAEAKQALLKKHVMICCKEKQKRDELHFETAERERMNLKCHGLCNLGFLEFKGIIYKSSER